MIAFICFHYFHRNFHWNPLPTSASGRRSDSAAGPQPSLFVSSCYSHTVNLLSTALKVKHTECFEMFQTCSNTFLSVVSFCSFQNKTSPSRAERSVLGRPKNCLRDPAGYQQNRIKTDLAGFDAWIYLLCTCAKECNTCSFTNTNAHEALLRKLSISLAYIQYEIWFKVYHQ